MWSKLLFALLLLAAPLLGQQRVVDVRVSNAILDSLDALADGVTIETVRCLVGGERGDTLYIDHMYEPMIETASRDSVVTKPCSGSTIAVWHNHIYDPEVHESAASRCFLSAVDVNTALRSSVFIWVVQVGKDVTCWWTRPQITILAQRFIVIWPLEGQIGRIPRAPEEEP